MTWWQWARYLIPEEETVGVGKLQASFSQQCGDFHRPAYRCFLESLSVTDSNENMQQFVYSVILPNRLQPKGSACHAIEHYKL